MGFENWDFSNWDCKRTDADLKRLCHERPSPFAFEMLKLENKRLRKELEQVKS